MRVRWTRKALANLEMLASFIARDDPIAASRMVERTTDAVSHLVEHPGLGRPGRVPGTRELIVPDTPFIVPYRARDGAIEVLRVLHAARRWPEKI